MRERKKEAAVGPQGQRGRGGADKRNTLFLWGCCVGGEGVSARAALREDEGYATGWQPHRKYITVKPSEDPPKVTLPCIAPSPLWELLSVVFALWSPLWCDGGGGGSVEEIQNTTAGIIVSDDVSVYVKPARDVKHTFLKNKRGMEKLLSELDALFGFEHCPYQCWG